MHYDPARSSYVDNETGEVVFVVDGDEAVAAAAAAEASRSSSSSSTRTPSRRKKSSRKKDESENRSDVYYTGIVAAPANELSTPDTSASLDTPGDFNETSTEKKKRKHRHRHHRKDGEQRESEAEKFERMFEMAVLENQRRQQTQDMTDELYSLHLVNNSTTEMVLSPYDIEVGGVNNTGDIPPDPAAVTPHQSSYFEDWNFARTLQALEFEIGNDEMQDDGFDEDGEPITDFERKEYRASRSCRRQLLTISFFICIVQIALLIAMIQVGGYAPRSQNSVIGPPVYIMVRFGAKQTALIVQEDEWFRLVAPIMLHAGIFHLIPNVAIQLRVGGYLNLVYGTPKWLWIYFASGIYGVICSCLFLPDAVGVGSSGALMGMLASWVVWIIFRWNKIPRRCHSQRNCQLGIVTLSIVITLATSTMPNVDWSAHLGGAVMGVLFGIIFLTNELDNTRNSMILRVSALVVAIVLYATSLWYLIEKLKYSTSTLDYWAANDDWK